MSGAIPAQAPGLMIMYRSNDRLVKWTRGASTQLKRLLILTGIREPQNADGAPANRDDGDLLVARVLRQLADNALGISDCLEPGEHYVAAIRLYCDALECAAGGRTNKESGGSSSILSRLPEGFVSPTLGNGDASLVRIERALSASLREIVVMDCTERRELALDLRRLCDATLERLDVQCKRSEMRMLKRPLRLVLTIVTMVGLVTLAAYFRDAHRDLARGRPWRASSELAKCRPVEFGGCPLRQGIFFHTKEDDNPWIEYDLGTRKKFSSALVANAPDSNRERAVPLVLEVADDQSSWREVARISRDFQLWEPAFPPVTARYVRFRVPRVSHLHLGRIEIHK